MRASAKIALVSLARLLLLALVACGPPLASHAEAPQQRFDHLTTGFELDGAHRDVPCESCHVNAVFKGTPRDCSGCHFVGSRMAAAGKPANHIMSSDRCDTCHTTSAWNPAPNFDHSQVLGNCSSCHNNVQATGKPANHLTTSQECNVCHSTVSWGAARFDHAGITSGCATCHGAGKSFANIHPTEPPPNHIPVASIACESCHARTNFTTFSGTAMNHAAVSSIACSACHDSGMSWFGVTMVDRPTAAQDPNHPKTGDCSGCHGTTSFTAGVTKPANHIPTTQTCTLCHSNSKNYAIYTMSHAGITSGCATCHGKGLAFANIVPKEPPANHMPTAAACESCHSRTAFTAFSGTAMNHTGITSNCASCHETGMSWFGVTMVDRPTAAQDPNHPKTGDCSGCHGSTTSFTAALTKPANHIPTTQACTLCHTTPSNYAIYTMSHAGITSGCATCHGKGLAFANIVPKEPPANHIPTAAACESCHSKTVFTAFSGTAMNHTGITSNCASCHETGMSWFGVTMVDRPTAAQDPNHPKTGDCSGCHGSTTSFTAALTKPANHIPTTQACALCHTNPSNFAIYTMNHAGITSGCATCHGKGLAFANIVPKEPPANHIPTAAACETCHSKTVFTAFSGTAMNHTGITSNCASCHETGMSWFGVTMVDRPTAAQDPNHPKTGDCSGCHGSTTSFTAGLTKPANHIPTTQACALCHTNLNNFAIYTMNHAGIASGCATCHGKGLAFANIVPKEPPANHIPTAAACESCHSKTVFTAFSGTAMNHTGITSNCASCHETGMSWFGVTMVDRPTAAQDPNHPKTGDCSGCHGTTSFTTGVTKPANHIPTTQVCTLCHTNLNNFAIYTMNHAGITSGCATCHGKGLAFANIVPKEPPANHIPTAAACETCHSKTVFTAFSGTAMNHTGITSNCASCHETGMSWFGVTMVDRPTAAQDPNHPKTGDCSGCHTSTTSFNATVTKPANHIPTTQACALCHTNPSNFAIFTMNHAGIASGCATCHGPGLSFANIVPKEPPANHIPTAGIACEGCHAATNFITFGGTVMNHGPVSAMACDACHETGMSWFGVKMVDRPPGHHTGVDCKGCHTPGGRFNGVKVGAVPATKAPTARMQAQSVTPASTSAFDAATTASAPTLRTLHFDHLQAAGACVRCHNGIQATGKGPRHVQSDNNCDNCHTTIAWAPARFDHQSTALRTCKSCHNGIQASGQPAMHVVTSVPCGSCHSTIAWLPARFDHSVAVGACASCHNGRNASGKPVNHIATSADCGTCHITSTWYRKPAAAPAPSNPGRKLIRPN